MSEVNNNASFRQGILDTIRLRLGDGMIDVELTPQHYEVALNQSIQTYRQRAEASMEESYAYVHLFKDQQEYILPDEILIVKEVYRQSMGGAFAGSFGANRQGMGGAFAANSYTLRGYGKGELSGQLLYYDLYHSYLEVAGRMFGAFMVYNFNRRTKKISFVEKPKGDETVLLHTWNFVPEELIWKDQFSGQWLQEWALAECKEMLGTIRGKFATYIGPQGGSSLDGDAMKQDARETKDRLIEELKNYVDGSKPMPFIIG